MDLDKSIDALAAKVCSFTRAFRAKAYARDPVATLAASLRTLRTFMSHGKASNTSFAAGKRTGPASSARTQCRVGTTCRTAQVGGNAGWLLLRSRRLSWNRGPRRPSPLHFVGRCSCLSGMLAIVETLRRTSPALSFVGWSGPRRATRAGGGV
jgi:hypothetical protein